ncbi:MAG: DNA-binding Lrp family transcriptional regulator [Bacteroidia bacterium]|jgi:DNA-binding Lrp family transcriptional regulator
MSLRNAVGKQFTSIEKDMKNGTVVDDLDLKILKLLQSDAKLTAKNLGDRIALSQTPVYERIKKLERNGVIKKYVALLEPKKLNKSLVVFMNITIREHAIGSRDLAIQQITSLDEVTEFFHTSGQFDFVAKVRVSKVSDYRDFLVEKMTIIDNIKKIESHIVLEEIKYSTSLNT